MKPLILTCFRRNRLMLVIGHLLLAGFLALFPLLHIHTENATGNVKGNVEQVSQKCLNCDTYLNHTHSLISLQNGLPDPEMRILILQQQFSVVDLPIQPSSSISGRAPPARI